jgi:hypothetical protein
MLLRRERDFLPLPEIKTLGHSIGLASSHHL